MADWAFIAVILSAFAVVVSGFGLWALLRTIKQGEEALEQARRSSEGDRAWLLFEGVETREGTNSDILTPEGMVRAHKAVDFAAKWKNSGKTPAIRTRLFGVSFIAPMEDPPPHFEIPEPLPEEQLSPEVIVAPDGPFGGNTGSPLYGASLDGFMNRQTKVAFCVVEYYDIYGQRHVTSHGFEIHHNGIKMGPDDQPWLNPSFPPIPGTSYAD